jgi:uncharacterized membrane protein
MRGSIWTVVVVGVLFAVSPAVLSADSTTFATNITPLFSSLAVVGGLLLFLIGMGAVGRYVFAGGGGGF